MDAKASGEGLDDIYPEPGAEEEQFDNSMKKSVTFRSLGSATETAPTGGGSLAYSRLTAGDVPIRGINNDTSSLRVTENIFNRQSSYVPNYGNRSTFAPNSRDSVQTVESLREFVPDRGFVFKLQDGHTAGIFAICVHTPTASGASPLVITGSDDKTAVIWNLHTGDRVRKLEGGHTKAVTSIAVYAPEHVSAHTQVVTGSRDSTAVIWDFESGKIMHKLKGGHGVSEISSVVVYTPTKAGEPPLIVTGGWDYAAVVWDLLTGQLLHRLEGGHTGGITSMALYNPTDGTPPLLVTGSADETAAIWNLTAGEVVRRLKGGHTDRIFSVYVHAPRGVCAPLVITGSEDTTAVVWDLHSGSELTRLEGGHTATIASLAVYSPPDGISSPLVLTASEDKSAVVWDLATGVRVRRLDGCHTGAVHAAAVYAPLRGRGSPLFLTGAHDKIAVVWDLWSAEQVRRLEGGHEKPVKAVAVYTPPNNSIPAVAVTGGDDKVAVVWDLQTQQPLHTLENGHTGEITAVVIYSPPNGNGGPLAITGSEDKTAVVWDAFSGKLMHRLKGGHTDWITCLAVYQPADGFSAPLLVSGSYDKTVVVWELLSGKVLKKLGPEHAAAITAVEVFVPAVDSYTTPLVVSGGDDNIIVVWDLESGHVVRRLEGHLAGITCLVVHCPNENAVHLISSAREQVVMVWDLQSGKVLHRLQGGHTEWISSIKLYTPPTPKSPTLLVTAGKDAAIVVRELHTGKVIRRLDAVHDKIISQVAIYEPKDHRQPPLVLSASHDGTAALWKNALLPFEHMPLMDEVLRLFHADLAAFPTAIQPWSRIQAIYDRYGEGFWYENHQLFRAAITDIKVCAARDSFLDKYQSILNKVVHLVPLIPSGKVAKCILQTAVERKLRNRHSIFDAWITVLNSRHADFLWQVFHPSLFLRRAALLTLSDIYPAEFIDFICKLNLVRSHNLLYRRCMAFHIDNFSGMVIEGMPTEVTVDMWTKLAGYASDVNDTSAHPVTAYMLPLAAAADMKLLQAYVDVSVSCDDLSIFNSDVGNVAFRYAWRSFGKEAHLNAMFYYSLFLAVYTCSVVVFDRLHRSEHAWGPVLAWILQAAVLRLVLKYIMDEIRQCYNDYSIRKRRNDERLNSMARTVQPVREEGIKLVPGQHRAAYLNTHKRFRFLRKACSRAEDYLRTLTVVKIAKIIFRHFGDFWNQLDLAVILMVLLGTLLRCFYGRETDKSRSVLALGCVLVWFKLLYFMRPFKGSGPLVTMILRIMSDIKFFLFILAVVLTGFALAFWTISYPDKSLPFGTIPDSFINTFLYMLGQNISADFGHTSSPQLGVLLLVLFMLFMMILMLNLLIALMANSFKIVQSKGLAQWRLEQASMMLEQRFTLSSDVLQRHRHFNRIHVLKATALVDKAKKESLRGGEKIIRRDSALGGAGKGGAGGEVMAVLDAKLQAITAAAEARSDQKAHAHKELLTTQLQGLGARQNTLEGKLDNLESKMDALLNKLTHKDSTNRFGGLLNPFAAATATAKEST